MTDIFSDHPVMWDIADGLVDYDVAHARMQSRAAAIATGDAQELVWCVEHPPLYTAGTSADPSDLVDPNRFEVHKTGRGGQYTYHGPGQRTAYAMLDLRRRGRDVSAFVRGLEQWIIDTLADFEINGERRTGRVGVWVVGKDGREDKVAAIGVRLKRWVSFHGIAINLHPDLTHFDGIVPCGIREFGVTSFAALGRDVTMAELDIALKANFERLFAPTETL